MKRTIQNMKEKQDSNLVTIKQAAKILEVSRQSIYHYRLAELLKPVPTQTGRVLFERAAILEFKKQMDEHKSMPC